MAVTSLKTRIFIMCLLWCRRKRSRSLPVTAGPSSGTTTSENTWSACQFGLSMKTIWSLSTISTKSCWKIRASGITLGLRFWRNCKTLRKKTPDRTRTAFWKKRDSTSFSSRTVSRESLPERLGTLVPKFVNMIESSYKMNFHGSAQISEISKTSLPTS